MKKSSSIIVVLLTVILIAGLGYMSLFGVGKDKVGGAENIKLGLDLAGGVSITYEVVGEDKPSEADMSDTIYKLQKRVEVYSTEAQVYKEGENRINIEIPGVTDANAILEELGRPGSLYFIAQTDASGNENYTAGVTEDGAYGYVLNKSLDELLADGSVVLTGTDVKSASAGTYQDDQGVSASEYVVELVFTDEGTKAFAKATEKAYKNGESIGIYYDGSFVSVPMVENVIGNGQAVINGMDNYEEAESLASTIRIGGLKLELEELRSNVVGAQLGSTAIETSIKAGIIGLAIVCVFMIVVYLLPGFASAIALIIYVILTLLVLNAFEVTLTLPGIAGIILSVGMAVDANVIIFARIREEIATGKTVNSAIKIGFDKAKSAIIDGNVTTLIAALVLGLKGSGTVKGFAQTLAIGIILSMFTAMVVTKLLVRAFYGLGLKSEKLYGSVKEKNPINFTSKKNIFFIVSGVLILSGFVFMGVNKASTGDVLNYSLEFKGGTSTNVTFGEDMTIEELDAEVVPLIEKITGDGNVQTTKVADSAEVIFKTRTLSVAEREEFNQMLADEFGVAEESIQTETISATVSSEMKSDAIFAVVLATLCMLLYIRIRFKDYRFAISAVAALVHDVLVVLAFYAAAKVSVGNTFIACMLTIVGYSINATIVVFDRVRENMYLRLKDDLDTIVNVSISQTLTRSIYTSFTTFVMVAVLYILGVSSIREFALPLMVGIVCGTYSSVCLAGSMWLVLKKKFVSKKKDED